MDDIRRAIAQIKIGAAPQRGTGFLVSADGLVLTALHVIADLKASWPVPGAPPKPLKLYGAKIELRFGDPRQVANLDELPRAEAQIEGDFFSVEEDWVLLRCKTVPDARPLALVKLADGANPVLWDSWGFASSDRELGTWFRGDFVPRPGSDRFELFSPEAAAGRGGMIPGLSGAPLLVANEVVGLVQSALLEKDANGQFRSIEGKLFGRRLRSILDRCPALKFTDESAEMRFELDVKTYLKCFDVLPLRKLASALEIDLELVRDEALPGRIMRRFASLPFERCRDALGLVARFKPEESFQLLRLAAVMSLHPEAVEAVRVGGARMGVLGAWLRCQWSGSAQLFAFCAHLDAWPVNWEKRTLDLPLSGEMTADTVLEVVRAELKRRFPAASKRPEFEFCLILRVVLAAKDLERICGAFPKARVLIATPPAEQDATLAAWLPVRPELQSEFEQRVEESFEEFGVSP